MIPENRETETNNDSDLRPGDIMFGPIGGVVPGFVPVGIGQMALFVTRRWWTMVRSPRRWFRIRHVAVIARRDFEHTVIQAMPNGCEEVPFDFAKHFTGKHVYVRPYYHGVHVWPADVVSSARRYVGTPYGFLTYAKLAAGALRMRSTERWLRKLISTRRDMICSQHMDQALADAGYHVFDDGRLPQDVVPAELFDALMRRPGWFMIPGHPVVGQWTHTGREDLIRFAKIK
jgi:hypothetical protein